jgi:hypothetical protein
MKRTLCISVVLAAFVAVGAALASDGDRSGRVSVGLARATAATARFQDVNAALAAGYVKASECVAEPGLGGMGFHYLNPAYAADQIIDPAKPELLVYAPRPNGKLRLVAVEWFRADADQNLLTYDDRPSLAGIPFNGPMLGHSPGMPIHYDLHAWIWKHNPAGTFAQYNPKVGC